MAYCRPSACLPQAARCLKRRRAARHVVGQRFAGTSLVRGCERARAFSCRPIVSVLDDAEKDKLAQRWISPLRSSGTCLRISSIAYSRASVQALPDIADEDAVSPAFLLGYGYGPEARTMPDIGKALMAALVKVFGINSQRPRS